MLAWESGSACWAGLAAGPGLAAGLPSPAWPLALQVDRSNKQVRLFHVTASGVMEDDTHYKKRLSLGEDKALSLSAVTLQDARTFMCQVGAGSYGMGESSTELSVYSEWHRRAAPLGSCSAGLAGIPSQPFPPNPSGVAFLSRGPHDP